MKYWALILSLAFSFSTHAMLRRPPEILSVAIDPANPDIIFLFSELHNPTAISTNGGSTFKSISKKLVPSSLTTNLSVQNRRYALVSNSWLLRSDDSGGHWTNTTAHQFVSQQINKTMEHERDLHFNQYEGIAPAQSQSWHYLFGVFAFGHCLGLAYFLRKDHSWLQRLALIATGVTLLGLIWTLFVGFHYFINWNIRHQWPGAHWDSSARFSVSEKTLFVMGLGSNPLHLLGYLLGIWWILPGSLDVMKSFTRLGSIERGRVSLFCAIMAILMLVFHACLIFKGYWNGG